MDISRILLCSCYVLDYDILMLSFLSITKRKGGVGISQSNLCIDVICLFVIYFL